MALDILLVPFLQLVAVCLRFYKILIFAYIIVGLLLSFNVVNRNNLVVFNINNVLMRLIEPTLSPIRRVVPIIGMFDFSPIILLFLIQFVSGVVNMTILKYFGA